MTLKIRGLPCCKMLLQILSGS